MSAKLYQASQAGIRVVSGRKIGDVRIPNYVYDLWLPLIGGDALSVYGVYCRLERANVVKAISLRDIAKACRIGDNRLEKLNLLLQECGFIVVQKPKGKQRGQHYTTEITTYNPPHKIAAALIEKLKPPSGYVPLSAWLVEPPTETPNDVSSDELAKRQTEFGETSNDFSPKRQMTSRETPNDVSNVVATLVVAALGLQPLEVASTGGELVAGIPTAMPASPEERGNFYDVAVTQVVERMHVKVPAPYTDAEIADQTARMLAKHGSKST